MNGVVLPHLSELDPDTLGEGKLDPMGLAGIADELAERIAPFVTARMSRIRFITAMAVGSVATERLVDEVSVDGQTTAELAFEWHVLEAFARAGSQAPVATSGVPGINKARRAIASGQRLSRDRYLKTPKVFGFNGVYKRLGVSFDVVHDDRTPSERAFELVAAWERPAGLDGFAEGRSGTVGGQFADDLEAAVLKALQHGRVSVRPKRLAQLFELLRPDRARGRERALLRDWLASDEWDIRRELIARLGRLDETEGERDALRAVRGQSPAISRELRLRLDAIEAYERVAKLLVGVFDAIRYECWLSGSTPTSAERMASNELVRDAAASLAAAMAHAEQLLDPLGLGDRLHRDFGEFTEPLPSEHIVELCLQHHEEVQRRKPPIGKRPWFERAPGGFIGRLGFELTEAPEPRTGYIHPYRVGALCQFIEDVL